MTTEDLKTAVPPATQTLSCEEAEVLLSRRIDGELDEGGVPVLAEHLAQCEQCRGQLAQWQAQSAQAREALAGLWGRMEPPVFVSPAPSKRVSIWRRRVSMPVGIVASQAVALAGLVVYFVFFGSPASAPRYAANADEHSGTKSRSAEAAHENGFTAAAPKAAITPAVPVQKPEALPQPAVSATPHAASGLVSRSVPSDAGTVSSAGIGELLAEVRETGRDQRVDNVSMLFHVPAGNGQSEMNGRVFLYGDIPGGKGWVRIMDAQGRCREFAQSALSDVPAALRPLVKHFLAECSRPELRHRLKTIPNE